MKVSVSLPEEDVDFLDAYVAAERVGSRSAAVHRAVRLLRASELGPQYEAAFREWDESGDAAGWEDVVGDGLSD